MPMLADRISPNDEAEQLIGRRYLSPSSIACYQRCPLQFYFKYILGLPEEEPSPSLRFGRAVHAAIERYYRAHQAGEGVGPGELLEVFEQDWSGSSSVFSGTETANENDAESESESAERRSLAERLLGVFLEHARQEEWDVILGIEEEFRGPLIADGPDLLARIDLLTRRDDTITLTDFKTSRSRWSAVQAESSASQLLLYADLVGRAYPAAQLELRFVVLTKGKQPAVEIWPIELDSSRLARQRIILARIWSAIQAGSFYPTPSPMACSTCPYQDPCQHWPEAPTIVQLP